MQTRASMAIAICSDLARRQVAIHWVADTSRELTCRSVDLVVGHGSRGSLAKETERNAAECQKKQSVRIPQGTRDPRSPDRPTTNRVTGTKSHRGVGKEHL